MIKIKKKLNCCKNMYPVPNPCCFASEELCCQRYCGDVCVYFLLVKNKKDPTK